MRKDYTLAFTVTETGLDDPDQMFYENYYCGSERNYTGYCNPEVDKLIDQQSVETDFDKRRQIVWQIERYLAEDGGRPIIFHPRSVTCAYPHVKGITSGSTAPTTYGGWKTPGSTGRAGADTGRKFPANREFFSSEHRKLSDLSIPDRYLAARLGRFLVRRTGK